jgi:hypothetical protein
MCNEVATRVRHVTVLARSCLTGVTFLGLTPTGGRFGRGIRAESATRGSRKSSHFDREPRRQRTAGAVQGVSSALELKRRKT